MKDRKQRQLEKELRAAGADDAMLGQLLPIASRLRQLKDVKPVAGTSPRSMFRLFRLAKPLGFVTTGALVGAFLVIVSQAALPSSRLYSLQKFSDAVAVKFHPQYRASVMMKRAQQVNELVVNRADSKQILAVLADYTNEASAYKSTIRTSYAAFEYCKSNLQQAAVIAPPNVRQAISVSLQSLEA